jgi:hypothetical protein
MGRHKHDWTPFLREGETLETVSVDTLKKRKHDALGGQKTSRADKVRLNKLQDALEEKAEQGRLLDPALDSLTDSLTKLAHTYKGADKAALLDMIWFGKSLLRGFNYQKESVAMVASVEELQDIWGRERDLPYESQIHAGHFTDSQTREFIGFARSVHLPAAFVEFECQVLSAVLAHANSYPENFERRDAIEAELSARQNGIDTAFPRPIAVKPPKTVSLPLQTKNYQTAEDVFIPDPKPSLTQTLIEQYKAQGGRVDWSKLADEEIT